MYKYSLEKGSRKFHCPRCNKKRYVRYVNNINNEYADYQFGKCDRQDNCGYHNYPTVNESIIIHNTPARIEKNQPTYLDNSILKEYCINHRENNLINFLKFHFPIDVLKFAIKKYFIGSCNHWKGATVFFQVDEFMNIRTGKIMLYNQNTGSRVKKPYPHISWMHTYLKKTPFVLQQCLFGIHNLCDYNPGSLVCIVESEKTAVIMSILYPDYLWLATGAKHNLKENLLLPLKNYTIKLFPDVSEFQNWNKKARELEAKGYKITTSSLIENLGFTVGSDLADIFL